MIDFRLTDTQARLQCVAREFAYTEVRPRAAELDRVTNPAEVDPLHLVRRASQLGLRTFKLPQEFGGLDADVLTEVVVLEELCVGDVGFGTTIAHPWREGNILVHATTEEQRKRFLPEFLTDDTYMTALAITECHAGSDNSVPYTETLDAGPQTTAELVDGQWILNGRKHFITAGNIAKLIFVIARTDRDVPWPQGVSMFLVPADTPGFRVLRVEDKLGLRVNPNTELAFENCAIPADNLVGELNGAMALFRRFAAGSKVKEAVKSLGIARAAYEEAMRWANERVQGGKRLVEHQVIAHQLAAIATQIDAARTLIWRAAWAVDHDPDDAPRLEGMAKIFATEMGARITVECLEIFGSYGIRRENPIEKLARDAMAMLHAFIGNHGMRENLARILAVRKLQKPCDSPQSQPRESVSVQEEARDQPHRPVS